MTGVVEKTQIGDITLILGDAIKIAGQFAGRADLIVSDIPYKLTTGGLSKSSKTMSGIFAADNYANDGKLMMEVPPLPYIAAAVRTIAAKDSDCYIMANDKNIFKAHSEFMMVGYKFHNLLTWNKITGTANRWYMKNCEYTLYMWSGRARTISDPSSKQLITCPQVDESTHPTEKPVPLMEHYIRNSSDVGRLVCDPFMGSGTTMVAAARQGRKGIGIEISPEYYQMAVERVTDALRQRDMFGVAV